MKQLTIFDPIADFYHSTSKSPKKRVLEGVKAQSQISLVQALMSDGQARTSLDVQRSLRINLNSARRALTDLYRKFGLIEKLEDGKIESEGMFNHFYRKV